MRLKGLFTELVCQLEGFAVAVAVMVILGYSRLCYRVVLERGHWRHVRRGFLESCCVLCILLQGDATHVFALALDL